MNKITGLLLLFVISSCSNPSNQTASKSFDNSSEDIISLVPLELKSVMDANYNLLPQPSSALGFGPVEPGQIAEQEIIIRNNQASDLVFSSSDIDASQIAPFQLVSDSCSSNTFKRGKICIIKMRLLNNTELTSNNELSKTITIKNISLNLTGTQIHRGAPPLIPVTGYIVGPLHLDFGGIKSNEAKSETVNLRNQNSFSKLFTLPTISNPKFSVESSCPAIIQARKSCSIKFTYAASSPETINNASLISLFDNQLSYSVVVESSSSVPTVAPVISSSSPSVIEPAIATGVIQFRNNGISTFPSPVTAVSSHSGITLSPPTCSGGLSRSKICSVSYSLNSALLPGGLSSQTVKLQSGSLSSSSYAFNVSITKTGIITYQPVYSSQFSACSAASACSGIGSQSASIESCQRLLDGAPVSGGQLSDCVSSPQTTNQSCNSQPGIFVSVIAGGSLSYNCSLGQTINDVVPTAICDTGYYSSSAPIYCTQKFGFGGTNSSVRAIAVQDDNKILIGGDFTNYRGSSQNRLVRLNVDGSKDTSFVVGSGAGSPVRAIAIQDDNKILIGGEFTFYNGVSRVRMARLNSDGSLDTSFVVNGGFFGSPRQILIQPDGKIIVVGDFLTYDGVSRDRIARLNSDGSLDTTFVPEEITGSVTSIALQSDGKIIMGGFFQIYGGFFVNRIARLNTNGTRDGSFNTGGAGANNFIHSLFVQSDNKIVIGGEFTTYNGSSRSRVARLNADGTLDSSFIVGAGANNFVSTVSPQSDGKIIIGGDFTSYNGVSINRIARIHIDGSLDTSFNVGSGFNLSVITATSQNDGKIITGGDFTSYNGETRNRVSRINADGSIDN